MKKALSALLSLVLALTCAVGVSAAGESAFSNIMITADTKLYDEAGTANPIAYMADYGVGYSSKGDQVIFKDVDFGENGANKMYINFSFGTDGGSTNIGVYIDKKTDAPAAKFNIGYTGGWQSTFAKEFTAEITVPAGKHDIIVEFLDETGSFNYIRFDQAPAKAAEVTASPATADAITVTVILAAASMAGAVVAKKRSK